MTKEEVKALIKAKIEGQGTNVDAGSVLPSILNGIIDLIDEGGGGTSDAVQYIPQELTAEQQAQARTNIGAGTSNFNGNPVLVTEQELTDAQKMQARKNQGLYYSEGTPAGVISWDGNTEGKESIDLGGMLAYKVANTPKDIPQDAWLGFTSTEQLETTPFSQIMDYGQMPGAEGKMLMGATSGGGVVIVADQFSMTAEGTTIEADGIYFTLNVRSFSYSAYDGEINHIEPKYIKDMYYEEEGTQSVQWDGNTSVENASFPIFSMMPITCYKASDLVPSLDDVVTFGGAEPAYTSTKGNFYIVEGTGNYQCCIVFKDYEGLTNEVNVTKGIYFSAANTPLVIKSTTVHQIPSKYIPQTIPVVKIEIPSNDKVSYGIGYVLLSNYVTNRDVVFSIEGKTINQVAVRNMLDTTSTGDVWDFGTGNTYNFDTSGYYLVEIEVQETPSSSAYYYATVFVETVNQ